MNLNKVLNSTDLTIDGLNQILTNFQVKVKVNSWGNRLVKVEGYTGSVDLTLIGKRLIDFSQSPELSIWDRYQALKVLKIVRTYYKITDEQIENRQIKASLIRRIIEVNKNIFSYIIELFAWPLSSQTRRDKQEIRLLIEGYDEGKIENDLRKITKEQILVEFPNLPSYWLGFMRKSFQINGEHFSFL